ncbi:hypothetical protein B0H11DRAFT_2228911 [Mycena galericulata]|nr:hypothetical protein B0H11DRAFT_2228911 [Mycena galericulata]
MVLPPGTCSLLAPLCIRATPLPSLYTARWAPFASRHHRWPDPQIVPRSSWPGSSYCNLPTVCSQLPACSCLVTSSHLLCAACIPASPPPAFPMFPRTVPTFLLAVPTFLLLSRGPRPASCPTLPPAAPPLPLAVLTPPLRLPLLPPAAPPLPPIVPLATRCLLVVPSLLPRRPPPAPRRPLPPSAAPPPPPAAPTPLPAAPSLPPAALPRGLLLPLATRRLCLYHPGSRLSCHLLPPVPAPCAGVMLMWLCSYSSPPLLFVLHNSVKYYI